MNNPSNNHSNRPQPGMTSMGQAMPDVLKVPVLTAKIESPTEKRETPKMAADQQAGGVNPVKTAGKLSVIEEGMTFTGNASLQGTCTIAGQLIGNLKEQANAKSQIVITETGSVKGDIFSNKVSVMGNSTGTIDASGGSVDLHEKSVVSGHIRYSQLQVNGADLNATLERVAKETTQSST